MAAPTEQYERMRRDLGTDASSLPNSEIDSLYDEAAEIYPERGAAQNAYARVLALQGLLANAAKRSDYAQGTTREDVSQVFDHLNRLLVYWQEKLQQSVGSAARFASTVINPARVQEWP